MEPRIEYQAWSDGSFDPAGTGGAAYIILLQEELIRYELRAFGRAVSPFHLETMALLMVVQGTAHLGIQKCIFNTDSKLLVDTLHPSRRVQAIQAADWCSYAELSQLVLVLRGHPQYCYNYISREENLMAHQLANRARKDQYEYTGHTFPLFFNL